MRASAKPMSGGTQVGVNYQARLAPGEEVTLQDVKNGVPQAIARLTGGPGPRTASAAGAAGARKTVRRKMVFRPSAVAAGLHKIIALPTRDGVGGKPMVVATYRLAKPIPVASVGRVLATRKAGDLAVKWTPSPDATGYRVVAKLSDGRVVSESVAVGKRGVTIPLVAPTVGGVVNVTALTRGGRTSRAVTYRLRATAKAPKRILIAVARKQKRR